MKKLFLSLLFVFLFIPQCQAFQLDPSRYMLIENNGVMLTWLDKSSVRYAPVYSEEPFTMHNGHNAVYYSLVLYSRSTEMKAYMKCLIDFPCCAYTEAKVKMYDGNNQLINEIDHPYGLLAPIMIGSLQEKLYRFLER